MSTQKLAIICTGSLAPGVNDLISDLTLRAGELGWAVIGIHDGFIHLAKNDTAELQANIVNLDYQTAVSLAGKAGSHIRIARSPVLDSAAIQTCVSNLHSIGATKLAVLSDLGSIPYAHLISETARDISVLAIPKTIDNDIPLKANSKTCGFETARLYGMDLTKNLIAETLSVPRWFIIEIMGKNTGHLAFSVATGTSSPLCVLPEDFAPDHITLDDICNVVEAGILKRAATGLEIGTCVISEGLISKLTQESIAILYGEQKPEILDDAELGRYVSNTVRDRLNKRKVPTRFCPKKFGYEMRGAIPSGSDCDLAKALADAAIEGFNSGKTDSMVEFFEGEYFYTPISEILIDGVCKTRAVNTNSREYKTMKKYQFNMWVEDFENRELVEKIAKVGKLTPEEVITHFKQAASLLVPLK